MSEAVHPPITGSLRFWRAWCREYGGIVKIVHRNPRGVIEVIQGGIRHIYHFDKYGKNDGKYSWGSSMPIDFMSQCLNAYCEANPDEWRAYLPESHPEFLKPRED